MEGTKSRFSVILIETWRIMIATNTATVQPADEEDDYLMELMGMKSDFPKEALDAYGKIYFRYWDIMLKIATSVTKNEDVAQDLVSDTFNVVYNKASTFNKGKVTHPDNIRLSIQKWMTVIMQNVFYDNYLETEYKKTPDNENLEDSFLIEKASIKKHLSDSYEEFIGQLDEFESSEKVITIEANSKNVVHIQDYMNKLPERDRDIILTIYNYYIPGKNTPSIVLDDLETRWGTTRQNIRKILEKFRKSIKETLQPHLFIRK